MANDESSEIPLIFNSYILCKTLWVFNLSETSTKRKAHNVVSKTDLDEQQKDKKECLVYHYKMKRHIW